MDRIRSLQAHFILEEAEAGNIHDNQLLIGLSGNYFILNVTAVPLTPSPLWGEGWGEGGSIDKSLI
ncbi:MAG: hypothetical protein ABW185_22820 [Sedimenticola sp.]